MLLTFHMRKKAAQESGATQRDVGGKNAGDMVYDRMCYLPNGTSDILPILGLYMGMICLPCVSFF